MEMILYVGIVGTMIGAPLLVAMLIIGLRCYMVHEDERLVVYRMGRFQRVAGPGLVWVLHSLEKIERRIDAREQPHSIEVNNLYFFDIPFGYTINLWYRLDPGAAARDNRSLLHEIARMPDSEIKEQIQLAIRNLLEKYLVDMPGRYNFSTTPSLLQKLVPVLPGQDGYNWLLEQLKSDLADVLRRFGVVLSADRPIQLESLSLAPDVVRLFNWSRTVQTLREQQPELTADALMHLVSAFEKTPIHSVRKFTMEDLPLDAYHQPNGYGEERDVYGPVDDGQNDNQNHDQNDSQNVDDHEGGAEEPTEVQNSSGPNSEDAPQHRRIPRDNFAPDPVA